MSATTPKAGDIVNNGHYDILLIEEPTYSEHMGRWLAHGRRWVPSRKAWQDKVAVYGWTVPHAPKHVSDKAA